MILDFIKPDLKTEKNLYLTVYSGIKSAVSCGVIKAGEKLPSVREAAMQLGVSRTTVENAYARLCIEGIAESKPQKGYYIIGKENIIEKIAPVKKNADSIIKYDFSSRRIDTSAADTESWKKLIRSVLRNSDVLTSYGNPQGEFELRSALAAYSYKARGVVAKPENIIIGAGIGPLLNILCGITGRESAVGIENGSFKEAESIFSDYGINTFALKSDSNGATVESLKKTKADILFLMPSKLSKISITGIANRRRAFTEWALSKHNRYIIEDDYNGELRYTARTLPAFQSKLPERCIYIGSFSKLLLPSVRIAYMVLPDSLAEIFREKMPFYNQTCGKTEQLALTEYINGGDLEKHLRRLRRLYYNKSQILLKSLKKYPDIFKNATLFETSLTAEIKTSITDESQKICNICEHKGIKIMPSEEGGSIKLCFAGIAQEDIPKAIDSLYKILVII